MFKRALVFHVFPFLLALFLILGGVFYHFKLFKPSSKTIEISQSKVAGYFANLATEEAEYNFVAGLKNKKQLTIFGSSEIPGSTLAPYYFFIDSLGIAAVGIGEAYHQHFSILYELLACDEFIDSANIVIIISPTWFTSRGTNINAFLKFVRPNFLKRIAMNDNIDERFKSALSAYIYDHYNEIEGNSNELNYFYYRHLLSPLLSEKVDQIYRSIYRLNSVEYHTNLRSVNKREWNGNVAHICDKLQKVFVSNITNNDLFVENNYYSTYLVRDDSTVTKRTVPEMNLTNNKELHDFKLLVSYLSTKSAKCSFIISPLNPYFYANTEEMTPIINEVTECLSKHNMPCLNMYVTTKEEYEPGVLKDVMHVGDYGWMQINGFLKKVYYD